MPPSAAVEPAAPQAPVAPAIPPEAPPPADAPPPHDFNVHAKWDLKLYGFVEADSIYDTTQGFVDLQGNTGIARPGTYTGDHGQTTFGARNSRIGIKLDAPALGAITPSGVLEMDFFGNQPTGTAAPTEQAFWQNPGLRIRHAYVKMETPVVDVLIGQTWQLFGWQTQFQPNTVQIQGVPGEVYSRSPQIRIGKKVVMGDYAVELALAAARPPQRDSATPDGHAGIKLTYNRRPALHTVGAAATAVDGLSLGVSAVGRRFAVNNFAATSTEQVVTYGYGLSVDALVPIIPVRKNHREHSLTLTGSYVTGAGISDLFTSLSGGVGNPALPNPGMIMPAPVYTPNVDNGLVLFYKGATDPDFTLHPVQWTSRMAGLQYYLPPHGHAWIAINYSHLESGNAHLFGAPKTVWDQQDWVDANLFVDVTPSVRLGVEVANTQQQYVDGVDATDRRVQFSAFFLY